MFAAAVAGAAPQAGPTRSIALAERLLRSLPERPRLLLAEPPDEGVLCWLATMIMRAQRWLIADPAPARIDAVLERIARWAQRRGLTATWPSRALLIHAPGGAWRIESFLADPAELMTRDVADAVIADHPPADAAIWRAYRTQDGRPPLLACLCATGHVRWLPRRPADALLRTVPPPRNPDLIIATLRDGGCDVASAVSDWRVPASSLAVLRALVEAAAENHLPAHDGAIEAWRAARLRQTLAARLAVRIGYRDILAFPPRRPRTR